MYMGSQRKREINYQKESWIAKFNFLQNTKCINPVPHTQMHSQMLLGFKVRGQILCFCPNVCIETLLIKVNAKIKHQI